MKGQEMLTDDKFNPFTAILTGLLMGIVSFVMCVGCLLVSVYEAGVFIRKKLAQKKIG